MERKDASVGWQADARDPETGAPVENKDKFPNGFKDVADKVHDLGLKVRPRCMYPGIHPNHPA